MRQIRETVTMPAKAVWMGVDLVEERTSTIGTGDAPVEIEIQIAMERGVVAAARLTLMERGVVAVARLILMERGDVAVATLTAMERGVIAVARLIPMEHGVVAATDGNA